MNQKLSSFIAAGFDHLYIEMGNDRKSPQFVEKFQLLRVNRNEKRT